MIRYPRLTIVAVYAREARSDRIGPLAAIGEADGFRVGIPRALLRPGLARPAETFPPATAAQRTGTATNAQLDDLVTLGTRQESERLAAMSRPARRRDW